MRHARQLRRAFSSAAAAEAPPSGTGKALHQHVAGRLALGRPSPTTLSVNGVHHVRHTAVEATEVGAMAAPRDGAWTFSRPLDKLGQPAKRGTAASERKDEHTMVVGGACSAVLSGKNLHRVLLYARRQPVACVLGGYFDTLLVISGRASSWSPARWRRWRRASPRRRSPSIPPLVRRRHSAASSPRSRTISPGRVRFRSHFRSFFALFPRLFFARVFC